MFAVDVSDAAEQRYRRRVRCILVWFVVGVASVAVYTALALLDVSLAFIWPLLIIVSVSIFKLLSQ